MVGGQRVETPTGRHLGTFRQGSPEWLGARRHGIGGSEIAAVLGLSPWESRYSLWTRKMGITGEVQQTRAMEWGHYSEPGLLAWYNDHNEPIQTGVGTYCHKDRPWAIANPDGLAPAKIVEAKTDRDPHLWGRPGTDHVPPYYRCQKLWYMDVLGLDEADLIASVMGAPPEVWTLKYDADDADLLREQARDFLDSVDTATEPAIDGHGETYRVIREMSPGITRKSEWHLTDELADEYQRACRDHKASEEAKTQAAARVLRVMGTAQYAMHDGKKVAVRQTKGDGHPFLKAART